MTDLEVYQPPAAVAVADGHDTDSWITVCSDVIKLANVVHDTEFVPEGLRGSAPAVAAAILAGREMGLGPMTALQHIHIIKGKPAQSALLMRALIQAAGHKWEDGDVTDTRAVVRGCRRGESKWLEVAFTADQAKRAGIELGKYPADKLYARATSRLARRKFADVIAGMPYSAEELEDGDEAPADAPAITAGNGDRPAQRTAQRRHKPAEPAPSPAAPAPAVAVAADQPPLPGEEPDHTDYDTPGTVTRPQLTKLAVVFGELGFARDERAQRLTIAGQIIGRDLTSSSELSKNEAMTLIDTLERCETRENLMALLTSGDKPGSSPDA